MRIHLCDDQERERQEIRDALTAAGAEVVGESREGSTCVAQAPGASPNVILLELSSGYDSLLDLRYAVPKSKIVVLSTSADPDLRDRVTGLGADAMLRKPDDLADLPARLQELLAA